MSNKPGVQEIIDMQNETGKPDLTEESLLNDMKHLENNNKLDGVLTWTEKRTPTPIETLNKQIAALTQAINKLSDKIS